MMGRLSSMMASLQASMQQPTIKYVKQPQEEEEKSISPWLIGAALSSVVIISMYVGAMIIKR
jgi:hypothetical protein